MGDFAIRVEDLSKKYHIGAKQQYRGSFRETLVDTVNAPFRRAGKLLRGHATGAAGLDEVIWALKDISFDVKHGEVVGIIGRNGAGKSTLLKILSRITKPTDGRARLYGRVGSLLEVGTGFHPELTGRENIYLNGAILGMRRDEIDRKFDEIVDFSGVEKFIDTPVKHYSSGMTVRLAFSVAAHLEPEILIVDEVLAVGDADFQRKCLGKMSDVAGEGRTVLFVSHNMAAVTNLCERALLLETGILCEDGPTDEVLSLYLASSAEKVGEKTWDTGTANADVDEFRLYAFRIKNCAGEVSRTLDVRESFLVEIEYEITTPLPYCRVGILVTTAQGVIVFEAYDADYKEYSGARNPGRFVSKCVIPGNLLSPGSYLISINAGIRRLKNFIRMDNVLMISVEDLGAVGSHMGDRRSGLIRPDLIWEREAR